MASTHIIITTNREDAEVYFSQEEFSTLMTSLKLDPAFCQKRSSIYTLVPDPDPEKHPTSLKALRLRKVGSTDLRHPSQLMFQEAIRLMVDSVKEDSQQHFLTQWREIITSIEERLPKKQISSEITEESDLLPNGS